MSASFADFDHDGRLDIFVTNDAVPNFLFRNNGDGTFTETALLAGVSVPDTGRPTSSMGVDAQDYDNDGWEDIHFTALTGETFPLFRNESAQEPRDVRRGDAAVGPGGADRQVVRLVLDRRRPRQRRLEGHLHRELARERSHRRLRSARVPPAEQPVPQRRPAGGSATRPRLPGSRPPWPRTAAAASPTSTATAASTSSSCRSVRPAELWQNDSCTGIAVADRAAGRHEEQPRRHRRAGHRRQPGADDDHGDGLCLVFTRGPAFRAGRRGRDRCGSRCSGRRGSSRRSRTSR